MPNLTKHECLDTDERDWIRFQAPSTAVETLLLVSLMSGENMQCAGCHDYLRAVLVGRAMRHDGRN